MSWADRHVHSSIVKNEEIRLNGNNPGAIQGRSRKKGRGSQMKARLHLQGHSNKVSNKDTGGELCNKSQERKEAYTATLAVGPRERGTIRKVERRKGVSGQRRRNGTVDGGRAPGYQRASWALFS